MYVCSCYGITESQVKHKADTGCFAFAYFAMKCKSNGCCKCLPRIKELINEENQAYSDTHYGGGID